MVNCDAPNWNVEETLCEVMGNMLPEEQRLPIVQETWVNLEALDYDVAVEKLQNSLAYIWNEERLFILTYFSLPADPVWFVDGIKSIQSNINTSFWEDLTLDGVIGPGTLEKIYTHYYIPNYDSLPRFQQRRIDVYRDMQNYRPRDVYNTEGVYIRTIQPKSIPNAFNDLKYWGWNGFSQDSDFPADYYRPIEWTMIANGVVDLGFDTQRLRDPNSIYIEVYNWKHILSVYNVRWECELATFTSPWEASAGTNGTYHKQAESNLNMYYISNDLTGAPMPYGINVEEWNILIHSWEGMVTWDDGSAGCFRVSLGYGNEIFDQVREMWSFTLHVNI